MRDFEKPGRSLAAARNGMAATSHPASTLTAVEVLKSGGTAIDAAVAACAVQCVVEAGSTGIGGDCFAMVSQGGSGTVRAYNGSGRTPAGLTLERLAAAGVTEIARSSPHAVTIPGAVDAWCRLIADFGRMSLRELLQPAIALAREGYVLTPRVVADIGVQASLLRATAATRETFLAADGEVPAVGDVQRQPRLADTLEAIGRDGRNAFYRGEIAREMASTLHALGGFHTAEDFAEAAGEYVTPITTTYRGRTVYEIPPNGQGIVALLILNLLSRLDPGSGPEDPGYLCRLVEATRIAYAARDVHVGDPAQAEHMLSPAYADRLAALVGDSATPQPGLAAEVEHADTVYICVVDKDRNAVSFINSIFNAYGSGLMAPHAGVLFHNRGQSFSLVPGHPNAVGPRKRPMHTIIPGMVAEHGRVTMPFGVMGGHYQAMGHAHFLSRLFDHGLDLQQAMDLPRLFPLPGSATVEAEEAIRTALGPELERRGYRVQPPRWAIGGSQAILIDWERGVLLGGSDHRKDGMALGY